MTSADQKPLALRAYVSFLTIAAAVLVILSFVQSNQPLLGTVPFLTLTYGALLIIVELKPLPSLTEDSAFTFSWTFAFAMMLVAPPPICFLFFIVASLASDITTRRKPIQYLFNAAQFVLSLGLAHFVARVWGDLFSVRDGGDVSLSWLAGVATMVIIAHALNSIFIAGVVALNQRLPLGTVALRFLFDSLSTDGLLFSLAPIFVVVGVHGPYLLPVLMLTVVITLHSASIALRNQEEATHDQLTALPNRRMFTTHADLAIEQAKQSRSRLAVLHVDLDGFKGINDRLGHHFGDMVLREIASRLRKGKRSSDLVARLGGDEFAVLLTSADDTDTARATAERILDDIEVPLEVEGIPLAVSASVGIAIYPDHGEDLYTLIHSSDQAMYQAKREDTGVEVFVGGESRVGPGRLEIIGELREAMDRDGDLFLRFQPVLDTTTGGIVRLEALLRWRHPTYGLVPPGDFMPQTEQTDLMGVLTDKILSMAFQACAEWQAEGIEVGVAVNASARNLHDLRFPRRVAELMALYGIEPEWVEIEITENTIMEDVVRSSSVLRQLRQVGISISIDDFGTGFSSLVALRDLTIDRIKIDRSFITRLDERASDLAIVRSVVELGHNLGLRTVAEGVESVEVLRLVQELGCHEYQGYLASPAQPLEELLPMLRNGYIVPYGSESNEGSVKPTPSPAGHTSTNSVPVPKVEK